MQQEVFEHLPQGFVESYRQRALDENIHLLSDYLAFTLHPMDTPIAGIKPQGVQP
jgi:hypothetical protein